MNLFFFNNLELRVTPIVELILFILSWPNSPGLWPQQIVVAKYSVCDFSNILASNHKEL